MELRPYTAGQAMSHLGLEASAGILQDPHHAVWALNSWRNTSWSTLATWVTLAWPPRSPPHVGARPFGGCGAQLRLEFRDLLVDLGDQSLALDQFRQNLPPCARGTEGRQKSLAVRALGMAPGVEQVCTDWKVDCHRGNSMTRPPLEVQREKLLSSKVPSMPARHLSPPPLSVLFSGAWRSCCFLRWRGG